MISRVRMKSLIAAQVSIIERALEATATVKRERLRVEGFDAGASANFGADEASLYARKIEEKLQRKKQQRTEVTWQRTKVTWQRKPVRRERTTWSAREAKRATLAHEAYGNDWRRIALHVNRTDAQCRERLIRGRSQWTLEDDLVLQASTGSWAKVARTLGKSDKDCRARAKLLTN